MIHAFSRTEMLIGREGLARLQNSSVAVFGLGGVGSYAVEALARSGIGHFILIDHDTVSLTNLNRQLIALRSTLGKPKVEVARARILDINPDARVEIDQAFVLPGNARKLLDPGIDYIVDAIDTVAAKIELAVLARELKIPIISCMGAGNKLDPTRFLVTDLYKTTHCPLSRVMRRELKKRGVNALKVVYSPEEPVRTALETESGISGRRVPGSISFVPPVAGLILAGEVVRDLAGDR